MNLILEAILSFLFSRYDFSKKTYINAVSKGVVLGVAMSLLSLLNVIIYSELHLGLMGIITILLNGILLGIAIMSVVYLIDRIFK